MYNPDDKLEEYFNKIKPDINYKIEKKWSGEIYNSADDVPLIGYYGNGEKIFIGTGYSGNGLTFSTLTAYACSESFTGNKPEWLKYYNPKRKIINFNLIKNGLRSMKKLIGGKLNRGVNKELEEINPDSGAIININGEKVAVYKDKDGKIIKLSPVCPHLHCDVDWNQNTSSWECPCHGSRFLPDGTLMSRPSTKGLSRKD